MDFENGGGVGHALSNSLFEQSKTLVVLRELLLNAGMKLRKLGENNEEIKVLSGCVLEASGKIGDVAVTEVTLAIGAKAMACAEEKRLKEISLN